MPWDQSVWLRDRALCCHRYTQRPVSYPGLRGGACRTGRLLISLLGCTQAVKQQVYGCASVRECEPLCGRESRRECARDRLCSPVHSQAGLSGITVPFLLPHAHHLPTLPPQATKASLDEVDPELLRTFDKLGIPLNEQKRLSNVAVDVVFDSVSIATTFKEELGKAGVIFCSISEAIHKYPELVKKYMGSVVSCWCCVHIAFNDQSQHSHTSAPVVTTAHLVRAAHQLLPCGR